eukprot:GEMP01075751.1.p1 GENE.GEMP01075751.1~~GEMP01075751.1.p1  ORF type:complete len:217 (+),score=35.18 GEMP01075751.1:100-750(+)
MSAFFELILGECCGGFGYRGRRSKTKRRPTVGQSAALNDGDDTVIWSGFLWKLNSDISHLDEKGIPELRNWRMRKFILAEYVEPGSTSNRKKAHLSYMSEKLEGISHINFQLIPGQFRINTPLEVKLVFTEEDARRTMLDTETYEVAFGDRGGMLQSTSEQHNIVKRLFLIELCADQNEQRKQCSGLENELSPEEYQKHQQFVNNDCVVTIAAETE